MASLAPPVDAVAALREMLARPPAGTCEARLAEIETENARLKAENERLRAENSRLSALQSKTMSAFRSPNLGAEKATGVALAFELASQQSAAPERTEFVIPAARLASQTGQSEHTVAAHISKRLPRLLDPNTGEIVQLFDRSVRYNHETQRSESVYTPTLDPLRMLDLIATAVPLSGAKRNGHGGKRIPTCPEHPDARVIKRTAYHCEACDRKVGDEPDEIITAPPPTSPPIDIMSTGHLAHLVPVTSTPPTITPETVPAPDVMASEQDAQSVPEAPPLSTSPLEVTVRRGPILSSYHNETLPPNDPGSIGAAWLRGAPSPSTPPARPPLFALDDPEPPDRWCS